MPETPEWLARPRIVAGMMTGTSLDAVDVAVVLFRSAGGRFEHELIASWEFALDPVLKENILEVINDRVEISVISALNFELAAQYALALEICLEENNLSKEDVEMIGAHGQTVWHAPEAGHTLQLISLPALAAFTGIPVAGDFRSADIALGGQGAPLMPVFDYHFLRSDKSRITLNIGGIANVTLLPANCTKSEVRAWDTGPGNVWIDCAVNRLVAADYDEDGEIARSGVLIPGLADELKSLKYIKQEPPKSTGRELFSEELLTLILESFGSSRVIDIIHTITWFTAWSIAENIRLFAGTNSEFICSGGGVKNNYLIELLQNELPGVKIISSEEVGIPSDSKEAAGFAFLAYLRMAGMPGNLPSVTGAERECVLGSIANNT